MRPSSEATVVIASVRVARGPRLVTTAPRPISSPGPRQCNLENADTAEVEPSPTDAPHKSDLDGVARRTAEHQTGSRQVGVELAEDASVPTGGAGRDGDGH